MALDWGIVFFYWGALLELYLICTTFTVPSSQYTAGILRSTSKRFLCDILYRILKHHVLCTLKYPWDNTNNATIQKHKKTQSNKSKLIIISHLWEITQVRLMVDPRSTCRSGEPWIRTCGTGEGKLLGFIFWIKGFSSSFFYVFFSSKHDLARSCFQCLARLCFMLNDLCFRHFWG